MVVWDESCSGVKDRTHDADKLVLDIVQHQVRRFSFFRFAEEVGTKLRSMSTYRTSRQVKQFANDRWTEMSGSVMLVNGSTTGMLVWCDAQEGSQDFVVQRVLCQDEEVSGQE